jgi:2-desacetyl-2-hydroxyethyl bacteriochlorophyllide A dehydrogenase
VVFTGAREVQVRDEPVPSLGPGDVLLRTLYTGISAGTEMTIYRGLAPQLTRRQDPVSGLFEDASTPQYSYPLVYGYAAVSRVADVADGVASPRVGDLVFSYTPHRSVSVVAAADVVALPPLDDVRVGVLLANLVTALNGVLDAHPFLGDACVVSGLGVVGLLVLQLLRRTDPVLLVGVDGVERRRALAARFGADTVLDPAVASVAREVRAITDNRGADVVVEVSGASAALGEAIRTVGYNGRLVALSWYGGSFESLDLSGEFHHNRPRVIASQVVGLNPELGPLWSVQRRMRLAVDLLPQLDLAPMLTHTFPVERAVDAYRLVDSGQPDLVQCVLSYGED